MFKKTSGSKTVFGKPLSEQEGPPEAIMEAIQCLELTGLKTEGLFRVNGELSKIQDMRAAIDKGKKVNFYDKDIHDLASLVKLYFRELPEPLLTYELYKDFKEVFTLTDRSSKLDLMKKILSRLPPVNYKLLKSLSCFLFKVCWKVSDNKMTSMNLAVVFGPNLLYSKSNDVKSQLTDQRIGQFVMQLVIEEYLKLFENASIKGNVEKQVLSPRKPTASPNKPLPPQPQSQNRKPTTAVVGSSGTATLASTKPQQSTATKPTSTEDKSSLLHQVQQQLLQDVGDPAADNEAVENETVDNENKQQEEVDEEPVDEPRAGLEDEVIHPDKTPITIISVDSSTDTSGNIPPSQSTNPVVDNNNQVEYDWFERYDDLIKEYYYVNTKTKEISKKQPKAAFQKHPGIGSLISSSDSLSPSSAGSGTSRRRTIAINMDTLEQHLSNALAELQLLKMTNK